jgi:hypothetical protein
MRKCKLLSILWSMLLFQALNLFAQQPGKTDAIYSGLSWYDQNGNVVSAHGGNIIKEGSRYYLFGEAHSDTSNAFEGFNCYSSQDLYNWKFESVALPKQLNGKLGPNRVGERVKVMKNPSSGLFVMLMHVDTLGYKDQFVGYATSKNITGPYLFNGPLLFNGKAIKKWDMGTFQDDDGKGYLLSHGGIIYRLSDDYQSASELLNQDISTGFESPTLFKRSGIYYFIGSHLSSWEKNDNYYYTSSSLSGPWKFGGLLAPKGKLTWNSQSTFVLKIPGKSDTTYMFMGDRWSYPKQHSAASYVWQPISFAGDSMFISTFLQAWKINQISGKATVKALDYQVLLSNNKLLKYAGRWVDTSINESLVMRSTESKASVSVEFIGTQIGIYGLTLPDNGYARVSLSNKSGKILVNTLVDFYSKTPASQLIFLSPILKKSSYKLRLEVTGERPNWSDKKKTVYGSTANNISISKMIIK